MIPEILAGISGTIIIGLLIFVCAIIGAVASGLLGIFGLFIPWWAVGGFFFLMFISGALNQK